MLLSWKMAFMMDQSLFHSQELNNLLPEVTLEFLNTSLGREIVDERMHRR